MNLPESYVLEQRRNRLAKTVNGRAIDLFEGDSSLAADWLKLPQRMLQGHQPIAVAAVLNLIGRLEHGVLP
jgi:uncharacterized protein (DUF2384 family)